ncbi:MAG: helix-turn-helix transcriptional regulator [Opitutales bacterium]|nr:helix-turn-helix transcriptional regulator [Opitutales bacterium]
MAFLIPHFEQALANARMVEAVGLTDAGPVSEQSRHILLDETGRPLEIPKAVEGCWRAFFPKEGRASVETPEAVRDWLVFARGLFDRGVLPTAVRPLVVSGPNSCLELRLTRRHFAPGYVLLMSVRPQGGGRVPRLTPREREVLHWVREGKTNEEIALILACKVTSVKTHLKHIFRKLGVDNRTAAARMSGL